MPKKPSTEPYIITSGTSVVFVDDNLKHDTIAVYRPNDDGGGTKSVIDRLSKDHLNFSELGLLPHLLNNTSQ